MDLPKKTVLGLGNPDEAPFPIARENQATKGSDSLQVRHESPQALWKRVAAALYACQVDSARIQHLCFMSVTDCFVIDSLSVVFECCVGMLLS